MLSAISVANSEHPEDKDELLISKIINAYGGREKLSKAVSISAEGRIKKNFPADEGTYYRYMKRERKLFVDIRYSKSSEKRVLNGKKGYREINGKGEYVTGPPYDAMVYQYNQLDLPFGFIHGTFKGIGHRKDTLNSKDVEVLTLKDKEGYEIEVFINSKDFLIQKVIGHFKVGGNETNLGAEFTDFRKVDGILLPFKIINFARGSKLSETEITRYQINPRIDDTVFNP